MKSLVFPLILLSFLYSNAQDSIKQKEYNTTKITEIPKIDGVLDDAIWDTLPELGDFTMFDPEDGTPELDTHKTKVKIGYTDEAI
ncbi:MAG: hydrolase, partial [Flavobacteriaceae bacterium]|nr:hydrolase [Flavobacteriaceae bacterium]